jgi:hypothetical protein
VTWYRVWHVAAGIALAGTVVVVMLRGMSMAAGWMTGPRAGVRRRLAGLTIIVVVGIGAGLLFYLALHVAGVDVKVPESYP